MVLPFFLNWPLKKGGFFFWLCFVVHFCWIDVEGIGNKAKPSIRGVRFEFYCYNFWNWRKWMVCRYCVLLITGEDPAFLPGNKAFLDFASANQKEVLRFAYVYQRQQQPLCQALLHNQHSLTPQVCHRNTQCTHIQTAILYTQMVK